VTFKDRIDVARCVTGNRGDLHDGASRQRKARPTLKCVSTPKCRLKWSRLAAAASHNAYFDPICYAFRVSRLRFAWVYPNDPRPGRSADGPGWRNGNDHSNRSLAG
jgi:hypothetical protein